MDTTYEISLPDTQKRDKIMSLTPTQEPVSAQRVEPTPNQIHQETEQPQNIELAAYQSIN